MIASDQLATYILRHILGEILHENETVLPRAQLRPQSFIRYFEKKGIKTDLSAIEKYVDEMLQCVGANQDEFLTDIKRNQSISQAE